MSAVEANDPTEDQVTSRLRTSAYESSAYKFSPWAVTYVNQGRQRPLRKEVGWRTRPQDASPSAFLQGLARRDAPSPGLPVEFSSLRSEGLLIE